MDIFEVNNDNLQLDLGTSVNTEEDKDSHAKSDDGKEEEKSSESENYMELYVAKELKDKIEPLEALLAERK